MNHEHLSDERLQEILDSEVLRSGPVLPLHLGSCAACRERLAHFRRLYAVLGADPGFSLPATFADSVLDRMPPSRLPFPRRRFVPVVASCVAGALALLGLVLFLDPGPFARGALQILQALGRGLRPLADQFRALLPWLAGDGRPFIYGGLGLLSAYLVERLLRQILRPAH